MCAYAKQVKSAQEKSSTFVVVFLRRFNNQPTEIDRVKPMHFNRTEQYLLK